jgi:hypothetical protein
MRWARHVGRIREMENIYNIFIGKHVEKRGLGRPVPIWEDNIRMNLR